jgi:hypothetical protein
MYYILYTIFLLFCGVINQSVINSHYEATGTCDLGQRDKIKVMIGNRRLDNAFDEAH